MPKISFAQKILWAILLGFLGLLMVLCAWQVSRYYEKIAMQPPKINEYHGEFRADSQLNLLARTDGNGNLGTDIIALFISENGQNYAVNLGFYPQNKEFILPKGKLTMQAASIKPYKSFFQPNNNWQKQQFYYPDIQDFQKIWSIDIANEILYSQHTAKDMPTPRAWIVVNNHLNYALTWGILAGILAVFIAKLFINQRSKK